MLKDMPLVTVEQINRFRELAIHHEKLVNCLFSYIDRMNDYCPEDSAEDILDSFNAQINPMVASYLDFIKGQPPLQR